MTDIPTKGDILRCVDARVRKAPKDGVSDFEKRHAGILDVMEIVTVRKVEQFAAFGGAWAVWLEEYERGIEGIRRYRAKKWYVIDRPFFLDRFVIIRDSDGRGLLVGPTPAPESVDA